MARKISRHEWSTYRRLLGYARPYAGRLVVGIVFGLLFAGSTTGMLVAFKNVLARVFPAGEPVSMNRALLLALALPLLALGRGLGFYASRYLVEWVGNRVVMDLRVAMFDRMQELSLAFFSGSRTGELISRTSNDTQMVQRSVSGILSDIVQQPFVLLGAAGYLFWLDPLLAGLSLVLFPVCLIPIVLFGRRVRRFAREGQQRLADVVSLLQETLSGVRIVKAFSMEDYERQRFKARSHAVFRRIMKVARARAAVEPIMVEFAVVGISLVLVYARWRGMTVDEFFTFAAALVVMYDPAKKLSNVNMLVQQSSAAADRIFEVLDTEVSVREAPDARPFEEPVREVVFERVDFAYGAGAEPVLREVDLRVPAGQCLAIVGSSGSGKTTLVNLLLRFFDVGGGAILVNGRDIRSMRLTDLRRLTGLVTQETFLFNDTVAANIAYGTPEMPRERIEEAARRAHADGFIRAMPEGYDTVVGERGVRLSGGQRQRLAIARAILRDPPILILDEATSALDTESERQVQSALDAAMRDRTVFVIAHRLSTVIRADEIVVLADGRVVERGTHAELVALGGTYKRLYDLQFEEAPASPAAAGAGS